MQVVTRLEICTMQINSGVSMQSGVHGKIKSAPFPIISNISLNVGTIFTKDKP